MATLLPSEYKRLYSWWWERHITPKCSKWLQESLYDMESKVNSMTKLIQQDADSFAIRAEMYYNKRPELMKLVEEFHRAYRVLAERYDLLHPHKTSDESQVVSYNGECSSTGLRLETTQEQHALVSHIITSMENMSATISSMEDGKHELLIEESVIYVLFRCGIEDLLEEVIFCELYDCILYEKMVEIGNQKEKMERLRDDLVFKVGVLEREIYECRSRERYLNSELQERDDDVQLWEVEASSFYFDLQVSVLSEALLANKVYELADLCRNLEDQNSKKDSEIETMRRRLEDMETEIAELKDHASTYDTPTYSLASSVSCLEHNDSRNFHIESNEDDKISDLEEGTSGYAVPESQNFRTRVDETLGDEKKEEEARGSGDGDIEELMHRRSPRNGALMRDIPLDQVSECSLRKHNLGFDDRMLELWQTAEEDCNSGCFRRKNFSSESELEKEFTVDMLDRTDQDESQMKLKSKSPVDEAKRKITEILASDCEKLNDLQVRVQDLHAKIKNCEKKIKFEDIRLENLKEQIHEADETVRQLVDINNRWIREVQEDCLVDETARRKDMHEQTQRGSEKIGRLQLEVQKIHYVLLKLEDEIDERRQSKFSMTIATFLHCNRTSDGKRRKTKFCGCFRPPARQI